jgi:hypothetical protein
MFLLQTLGSAFFLFDFMESTDLCSFFDNGSFSTSVLHGFLVNGPMGYPKFESFAHYNLTNTLVVNFS